VSQAGVEELVGRALQRDRRALARLLTLTESVPESAAAIDALMTPKAGAARIVGVTGAPGVGKSTTVSALLSALRARDLRVAVLAVDPSSTATGGAVLGDRIRMLGHATDDGVFVRSLAARGQLGGLAAAVPLATRVLDAAGYDVIVLETVGVGQSEIDVSSLVDTTVVVLAPGMGDAVQSMKAGIIEVGDVFVVNKSDRDGAATTRREIRSAVRRSLEHGQWQPPVLLTEAVRDVGISELVEKLDCHAEHLAASGELTRRRRVRVRREVEILVLEGVRLLMARNDDLVDGVTGRAVSRRQPPHQAARAVLDGLADVIRA
jgi:LAO/AO transport system kinase